MSNLFTITIPDSAAALLVTYGDGALLRVQSCPTSDGSFGDIPSPTQPIVSGISTYAVYDADGLSGDWYAYRYEAADGDPAGDYSDPFQPQVGADTYASLAALKSFVRESSTDNDELMAITLVSASRAIDRACGRTFTPAGDVSDRAFTPRTLPGYDPFQYATGNYPYSWYRRFILEVDDFATDDDLVVAFDANGNGSFSNAVTGFRAGPLNAPAHGQPFSRLIFDLGVVPPAAEDSVLVTAHWGWSQIPVTIVNACLLQASRFWKRRDAPFGVAGSPEMGNELRLLSKLDPDVALMVGAYKRNWGAM